MRHGKPQTRAGPRIPVSDDDVRDTEGQRGQWQGWGMHPAAGGCHGFKMEGKLKGFSTVYPMLALP